ncbi:MAG: biotin--[acetyl-CoA-carboxylase] ligase [Gammaproteobacteria bacterium]|mgnify:FL=1|jgi:BirA family biotin operon repressor/biotin-[acetyl-CoA-carboxylase] ligase|nr:biotin--[acetyl-CoA-carboxylase] ligase [Gammaproteobacteria bacterium]|tara:strand:+ start:149 stop:904 length:756 start_codon:yes stop_codon:yes gene_type:complete
MNHFSSLKSLLENNFQCYFFESIDSTNSYLASTKYSTKPQICITREQTKGKGQHGRNWVSQKDGSIIFSMRKSFNEGMNLNGLSLIAGMAIIKSIEAECQLSGLKIKWPNDIYYGDKKLAGILMENTHYKSNQLVLVGVGINYQLVDTNEIDEPWVDLSRILNTLPNFQQLTAKIINNILFFLEDFQINGLSNLLSEWHHYDMLKGVRIKFRESNIELQGQIDGITHQGALKVLTKDGVKELYSSMHIEYI